LPQRRCRQLIAPFEKDRRCSRIVKRLERKVAELFLDTFDLLDVVAAGAGRDAVLKFAALLKANSSASNTPVGGATLLATASL
jgi:hypothetical protein